MNTDIDSPASSYPQPLNALPKSHSKKVLREDTEFESEELGERQVDERSQIPCEGGCQ